MMNLNLKKYAPPSLPPRLHRAACFGLCLWLCLFSSPPAFTTPKAGAINRVALLIGAGEYADPNINSLSGPPNDAASMKSVLVRRWGFAQENIKILTNKDATRANILKEMAALKTRSQPGDEVLVYFSGHGSSARDSGQTLPIPGSSGVWIPTDFKAIDPKLRDLILARTDLYPIFSQLEQGGRKLWVIVDACFSGQAARNAQNSEAPENAESPPRMIDLKIGQAALAEQAMLQTASQFPAPAPWPYQSTVYLAASAEGELARDVKCSATRPPATLDGKPHGAFTDALLRVLEGQLPADSDGDGFMSLTEVQRATSAFMDLKTYGHTPQRQPAVAEDENGLGSRPVLSVPDAAAKPKNAEAYYFHLYYENLPEKISTAVAGVPDVVRVTSQAKADIVLKLAENGQLNFLAASGDLIAEVPKANLLQITAQVRQLAWAYRLQASAKSRARGVLAAEITPSGTGGRFTPGQKIRFVARPDRAAALVLMNIDATGKVSVLYPHNIGDTRLLGKDEAVYMPINDPKRCIWVKKPFGMDLQFIFAFDTPPTGLADLIGLADADPDNPKLHRFMQMLVQHERKFTFTSTKLRVVESDSPEKMVIDNRSCGD
jgi:uncharacterized caspase-like protein